MSATPDCRDAERATQGGTRTHQFEVWECWYCGVEARLPYDNDVPFEEMWQYIKTSPVPA